MKKKAGNEKLKNITIGVLDFLLGLPEYTYHAFERKTIYQAINATHEQELTVSAICNFFNNMKHRGYLEIVETEHGESVRFTNKAKLKMVDRIADRLEWDGNYRFVSFDIPEASRHQRDQFRYSIKRMGFKQIQKSLWVSCKNVGELVDMAAREYGVTPYVVYIVSTKSDIDDHIRKMFEKPKELTIEKSN